VVTTRLGGKQLTEKKEKKHLQRGLNWGSLEQKEDALKCSCFSQIQF
jgi:hypothetical protein